MNWKKPLSIREFSRLTGIKPENLRFYDRIGLLSPERRGENNYRYYSRRQLSTAYLIANLRGLGVGIAGIKDYAARRTPENTLTLFAQQEERIRAEMRQLEETRQILQLYSQMIQEALAHGQTGCFVEERPREEIFLCPPLAPGTDDDEGIILSYAYAEDHGINLGFPQGTLVPQEVLTDPEVLPCERYYLKVGHGGNGCKPAGLYAVAYGQCNPWTAEPLYRQLLAFLRAENLELCGDAYEEYPLGDAATLEEECCIRIEVPVRRR